MQNAWSSDLESWVSADDEVVRAKRGEPQAFEVLLNRYQNRVFRYLVRFVGDRTLAEDLFQQTWLRVMTRFHRYDERRAFEPWLFSVARHLAIDHLRRKSPDSLDDPSGRAELATKGRSALEELIDREQRSLLNARLDDLPALYREAITLRFEEAMTFEEISELLQCPISTAKSRVQRALAALRKSYRGAREA